MKRSLIVYVLLEVVLIALLVIFMVVESATWALYALWGMAGLMVIFGTALLVATFRNPTSPKQQQKQVEG